MRNAAFHKLKKASKKHHVYEDKSDSRRKVVKVRGTLICNFMFRKFFAKFWYILYYYRPTMNITKKLY